MSITDTAFRYDVDDIDLKRGYRIYRNLHKQTWTVQHYVKGVGWRKFYGAKQIACPFGGTFEVSATGAARAARERRKNVHAFFLTSYTTSSIIRRPAYGMPWTEVTYSPYTDWSKILGATGPTFYIDGPDLAVGAAQQAYFDADGRCWVRSR